MNYYFSHTCISSLCKFLNTRHCTPEKSADICSVRAPFAREKIRELASARGLLPVVAASPPASSSRSLSAEYPFSALVSGFSRLVSVVRAPPVAPPPTVIHCTPTTTRFVRYRSIAFNNNYRLAG